MNRTDCDKCGAATPVDQLKDGHCPKCQRKRKPKDTDNAETE